MADRRTKNQTIFYLYVFKPKVAAGENNDLRKKIILRFIKTVMVPTGHQFCRHKISAHSGDRNMKPFAKLLKVQIVLVGV